MEDFSELMRAKVNQLDLTIKLKRQEGNKLYVCKTLHLKPGRIIYDENDFVYQVEDLKSNEWILVTGVGVGPEIFEGKDINCPPVYFLTGTPSSVNSEYQQIEKHARNKMPCVWLNENYEEDANGPGSSVERVVVPQLFFMDETDEKRWTNEQQHKMALQPMSNLADHFFESFKKDRLWKRLTPVKKTPRARFGVYIDGRGNDRKIIDEYISAVETRPTLTRYKGGCNC